MVLEVFWKLLGLHKISGMGTGSPEILLRPSVLSKCSWNSSPAARAHPPLTLALIICAIRSQLIPGAKMKVKKAFLGWSVKSFLPLLSDRCNLSWVFPAQRRHLPNTFSLLCSFELCLIWWLSLCHFFPVCSWSLWGAQISLCCTFFTFRRVLIG